ncbi:hypothetical protein EZV62_017883 [Acer yangbiense]|uniref:Uncharacterized protein n=1 Tax=Acer yangbiense TaxID=1000413 RepID=A0A5C7HHP4_9ROSI|nr:hypothetical protein EZV62_017883 [Acer yangbiense]
MGTSDIVKLCELLSLSDDGQVVRLQEEVRREGAREVSNLVFDKVVMWVQIHNLPLMYMNRRAVKLIAEAIGHVIELSANTRECRGKFLRVKVRIEVIFLENALMMKLELKHWNESPLKLVHGCGHLDQMQGNRSLKSKREKVLLDKVKASPIRHSMDP